MEQKSRQRQPRGLIQAARDQTTIKNVIDDNVGLVKMIDRLSRSTIGAKTAQSYAIAKTYAYEQYLIRKPEPTMDITCEQCGQKSVDNIVRYWKTFPNFHVAHLTETCSMLEIR